jgi:putative copper export protein
MSPGVVDVSIEVLYFLALAVPLGVGLTLAALAVPAAAGGVVAPRLRPLSLAAAVLVLVAATLHVLTAGSPPDTLAVVQLVGFALTAAGLVALALRPSRPTGAAVLTLTTLTALIPELPTKADRLSDVVRSLLPAAHLLAALCWSGGLLTLAVAGLLARRHEAPPDRSAADWAQIWSRFSTVAMVAVGTLVVTGSWLTWTHVGTVGQLLTTPYGRHLAIKLTLVLLLLLAGVYNVRVLIPRIRRARADGDTASVLHLAARHFPRVVAGEAVLAVAVLTVVPFLHGSARTQAGWPAARPFDLTTFGAGVLLVALVVAALWLGARSPRERALG